ncbi:fibrobacter succinogenes major paralogous domain-containing protein, partial [Bacteroides thetaiotaomicron]|uniref:fibrobacter succinogenes major paralogous domain-containing protein n=1 Tax=Bacteroides thetaiotaomicron TaxID=818 RepID=UPI00210B1211
WMAEPLRYVPDGYTPSSDPAADSHIWYPYQLVTVDGTLTAKALQDEASIKQYGYLYDIHAALSGKAVTPDNCYDFEGAQGICPKGWHIPTRAEYFSLVGNST